jgi:hypothetical protein
MPGCTAGGVHQIKATGLLILRLRGQSGPLFPEAGLFAVDVAGIAIPIALDLDPFGFFLKQGPGFSKQQLADHFAAVVRFGA